MSCSRRAQPPFDIFEDIELYAGLDGSINLGDGFPPITDLSYEHHNIFDTPYEPPRGCSPHKSSDQPYSSPRPEALSNANVNALQIEPPPYIQASTSPTKKSMPPPQRANGLSSSQEASLADIFPPLPSLADQENAPPTSSDVAKPKFEIVMEKKPISHKRSFTDGSAKERSSKKQKVQDDDGPIEIPDPEDMPPVSDPGCKPDYSYANLIGMSLLRAPNRRLTLSQIYKWISDNFSFYSPTDAGWQNSIRHNLSLNKNFIKQDRPKEDPGKGHYWTIQPGQEHVFLKEKQPKRPSSISLPSSTARPSTASSVAAPAPTPLASQTKHVDSSKFPNEQDLSSDATIPCSDPAIHDGQNYGPSMPPPSRALQSSPPQADIRSSPPAPSSRHSIRNESPLRLAPPLPGNGSAGHRMRKFGGLGDSGYYSSIESSAAKQRSSHWQLTSEAEYDLLPPLSRKPGRAELEISRIRSSSHDSPPKSGPHKRFRNAKNQRSSSPFRPFNQEMKRGTPLTPPVMFKRPALPPASVSPNTNLRNHRNSIRAMQSTPKFELFKDIGLASPSEFAESANFSLYVDEDNFHTQYDVFADMDFPSPEKNSVKRPRLFERAATSTGPLATITGSKANARLMSSPNKLSSPNKMSSPSKFLQDPDELDLHYFDTPKILKPAARLGSVFKGPTSNPLSAKKENMFMSASKRRFGTDDAENFSIFPDLHSDGSEEGFDIMQGFQKIGAPVTSVAANGSPVKSNRPALVRSTTSRF